MGIGHRLAVGCISLIVALSLSACGSTYPEVKTSVKKPRSKEYFAEAEYGVKASPRMVVSDYDTTTKAVALVPIPKPIGATLAGQAYALSAPAKSLRRGGGRLSIGKPYLIRGKWYKPADQPGYSREGKASWYGDAFHGRLTANGEIYDMNNLTAAHPTLPLPSYARVTNVANGTSVIVRINDRGPYAAGRVIDLSKRAAQVIDTKNAGVGRVRVDYIGVAPVDGHDDPFLLASFRQNSSGNTQEDLQMYAALSGGGTVGQSLAIAQADQIQPFEIQNNAIQPAQSFAEVDRPTLILDNLPVPVSRPFLDVPLRFAPGSTIALERFGDVLRPTSVSSTEIAGWKAMQSGEIGAAAPIEIFVGILPAGSDIGIYDPALSRFGAVSYAENANGIVVSLLTSNTSADNTLKKLWAAGYASAFALR